MPAGTVSGAPKVRAMEIIDELEPEKEAFTVAESATSVQLATWICDCTAHSYFKGPKALYSGWWGVVYDSVPEDEYMETVHKSNAIRRAAADAAVFGL